MTLTAMRAIGWFLLVVAFFAMEPAQKLKDKEETTTSTHAISLSDADVVETAHGRERHRQRVFYLVVHSLGFMHEAPCCIIRRMRKR